MKKQPFKRPQPGPGRPPGAKNQPVVHVAAIKAQCPACHSTDVERLRVTAEQAYPGTTETGQPYTHIVKTRCRCKKCGQMLIERSYEHRRVGK